MTALLRRVAATSAPRAAILIRLAVGAIFLSEGLQKLVFPATLGVGRFEKIGIPWPSFTAPFVATSEIGCGALVLAGLLTRSAAIPLIAIMLVAIGSTKLPILREKGFWSVAHEARTDFAMLLGASFLLWVGAGTWSVDARLAESAPDG